MSSKNRRYDVSELELDKLIMEQNKLDFDRKQVTWLINRIGAYKGYVDDDDEDDDPTWEPENITWEPAQGAKGPYERSVDVDSRDFRALLRELEHFQGKLARDGFFYWTFKNGTTVGRKQRKTQETQP